ncbi:DUF5676 family membrane protein [Dasania sp. GY-19]|uniref:DUF5676 family membrane protein n=1 Tax=Dasania phycosphaerae TaxID=2950436 RepID=A0A9J6RQD7_9GAMM|nr:DUF5676 family membrane protein [Dasania phycosphaerae]MCZ0866787.1 DUF5676 family membrane protein [Dasania phycosphaerae]
MKIHAIKFGMASSISALVLWIICSVLVVLMPSIMLSMSGDMLHMQLNDMGWHLTFMGVVKGLLSWSVMAGVTGWMLAAIYNRLQ